MIFDDVKHLKETGLGGLVVIHGLSESFRVLSMATSVCGFSCSCTETFTSVKDKTGFIPSGLEPMLRRIFTLLIVIHIAGRAQLQYDGTCTEDSFHVWVEQMCPYSLKAVQCLE
jgi:hypothetical protein